MNNENYVHLHVHNEYSYLDGLGSAKQWAKKAKGMGFKSLALTNHGNVAGVIKWQEACLEEGISPIIGCEMYIVENIKKKEKNEERKHITILVKNESGWKNLLTMLTIANTEGFYYKPRIDPQILCEDLEGIVIMTACHNGFISTEWGASLLGKLGRLLPKDCLAFEVMPLKARFQERYNSLVLSMRESLRDVRDIPVVLTNDCHYVNSDDATAQETMLSIQSNAKWTDKDRWKFDTDELFLKSANQMKIACSRTLNLQGDEFIENSLRIAEQCNSFRIKSLSVNLPDPKSKNGALTEEDFLRIVDEGYLEKIWQKVPDEKPYMKRLREEIDLLKKKGFIKYFLIVWEIVNWCKENNIMIGPGRGSVGGSIVAYLMGITMVDPLRYNLLFWRFTSPDRNDLPDIDIDFEDSKRHLVFEHIRELYGKYNVASVSTFMYLKGRSVIRDVGRVFDLPSKDVDEFAKSLEYTKVDTDILKSSFDETSEGRDFAKKYPLQSDIAMRLEGNIRGTGTHAAACVISEDDLREGKRGNLIYCKGGELAVCWEKDDAEKMGLMKMDILGLNALSVFSEANRLIALNGKPEIIFHKIPLDDKKILKRFAQGDTSGCFQFNSHGITKLCKDMRVSSFEDLVAINALYRPGTLRSGMVDKFVMRRRGKEKWEPIHSIVEKITKDTHGIIVYQEQLMLALYELAGLSWTTIEKIRKVVGKSKGLEAFNRFKEEFVKGCEEKGTLSRKQAEDFFDEMNNFGAYGFNRSHAVEYTMIGYWCMYFKHYFPNEFYSASLSYGSEGKKEEIVEEVYASGLKIKLPKVGISHSKLWIVKGDEIYCPFIEVKGLGEKQSERIFRGDIGEKIRTVERKKKEEPQGPKIKGFFSQKKEEPVKKKEVKVMEGGNSLNSLLQKMHSFEPDYEPSFDELMELSGLFSFSLLKEDLRKKELKLRKISYRDESVSKCNDCPLREFARAPVLPSLGRYNIAIIGESPGRDEDREGIGFIGDSGGLLWEECYKHGIKREYCHVTNVYKCFPGSSKEKYDLTKTKMCWKHLDKELKELNPGVALGIGNSCVHFFENKTSGIYDLSGTAKWSFKYGCWICYCIHPASLLYGQEKDKKEKWREGIKTFAQKVSVLMMRKEEGLI